MENTMNIVANLSLDNLSDQIINWGFSEEELAKFAVSLGEGGDCSYEIILLREITSTLNSAYPEHTLSRESEKFREFMFHINKCRELSKEI